MTHQPSAITKDRDEERSTLRHRKAVSVANNGIWTTRSTTMAKEGRTEEEETDSKDPLPQQSSLDTPVRILWNLEFTSLQLALFVHPSISSCITHVAACLTHAASAGERKIHDFRASCPF
jgi:hypothetical protein